MAAIGKIRSKGPWLVAIVALALFAFIAGDFWKGCENAGAEDRQKVGEVMGKKLLYQDYQTEVEEYKNMFKQIGRENIDEDDLRDFTWDNYVRNIIIEQEAAKLGLGVTDEEVKSVLRSGSHPILRQLPILGDFFDQQSGLFDFNRVTYYYNFLRQQTPSQYDEFDHYWKTVEKLLRQNLLASKYMSLLQACMLSNESSAKMTFDSRYTESDVLLAMLPYSNVKDEDVKMTDSDMKAKYEEMKEQFKTDVESRDLMYVVTRIVPSESDINNLRSTIEKAATQLRDDSLALADILGSYRSAVPYHEGMPFNAEGLKNIAYPLFQAIDSLTPGQVSAPVPYTVVAPNQRQTSEYLAVAKLINKRQGVDSLAFQSIGVAMQNPVETSRVVDSIMGVLNAGQQFDSVAISLGQRGEKSWISANQYQAQETINPEFVELFNALHKAEVGKLSTIKLTSGTTVIYKVVEKKQPVTLYDVAIVSNQLKFSNETYNTEYNKFSQYVSSCKNDSDMVKKADAPGYTVLTHENLLSTDHNIGRVDPRTGEPMIPNTRSIVKWAFSEATEGSISKVYDENASNGMLVAALLLKVHPQGYLDLASVEGQVAEQLNRDRKAKMLIDQLGDAKTPEQALAKGADTLSRQHINFAVPVSIREFSEPALGGAIAATEVGKSSAHPFKGNNGVYVFTVTDRRTMEGVSFDRRAQENQLVNNYVQLLQKNSYRPYTDVSDVLVQKAKVQDNRYKF